MKYECIIFDFDGTIADTSLGIFNSIRYASEKMGLRKLNTEELKSHLGPPMHKSYNDNFKILGQELEKAIELHKEYSLSVGYKEFKFYPGIIDVLKKMKEEGFKMGIATTKPDIVIKKICQENNLNLFFSTVHGAVEEETKTDIVMKCLEDFSNCSNVLVIGDSIYDLDAAMAINADFIGVTYGFGFSQKDKNTLNKTADIPMNILDFLKINDMR